MNKFKHYYGIDISKDVFDVIDDQGTYHQYENTLKGFGSFKKVLLKDACCVMEATGVYHVQLADYLYEQGIFVSVVNPLVIKRFIQMNLRRIKTDKADAEMICRYAKMNDQQAYRPPHIYIRECRILKENIDLLLKNRTMLKNRLHALSYKQYKHRLIIINPLKKAIKELSVQIQKLEDEMRQLIMTHEQELFSRLLSIPGIGKSTAMFMIILSEGFTKFESAKQFTCFIGLSPVEKSSGSSIRGRGGISKQGNGKLRNLLFLCSFNACKSNKACKDQFERIIAKGKSKKLALVAVSNKLLKQSFAIAKSGLVYDEGFKSRKPVIQ
ncbi:MAG: IS110 family transposase [Bacteroidetes bacterium]|nr:IS110 family transposase [Bacteroidota bacterium]